MQGTYQNWKCLSEYFVPNIFWLAGQYCSMFEALFLCPKSTNWNHFCRSQVICIDFIPRALIFIQRNFFKNTRVLTACMVFTILRSGIMKDIKVLEHDFSRWLIRLNFTAPLFNCLKFSILKLLLAFFINIPENSKAVVSEKMSIPISFF